MDYIFGHEYLDGRNIDTVKVMGNAHTNFSGEMTVVKKFSDNDITDTFKAVLKFLSADGADGTCYDWYEIKDHYRYIDKYTPQIGLTEQAITELEINSIEQELALTDAEIAILELQMA